MRDRLDSNKLVSNSFITNKLITNRFFLYLSSIKQKMNISAKGN